MLFLQSVNGARHALREIGEDAVFLLQLFHFRQCLFDVGFLAVEVLAEVVTGRAREWDYSLAEGRLFAPSTLPATSRPYIESSVA